MRNKFLMIDSRGAPVAHCTLLNNREEPTLLLEVDEVDLQRVFSHEYVTLMCAIGQEDAIGVKILKHSESRVWVEKVGEVGSAVRKNLRMPVKFQSFIYPVSGFWKGRATVISNDLSCGGISFYCGRTLEEGEVVEIVIPVTKQPVIVQAQILRQRPTMDSIPMYAARFHDLVRDEETLIQEAIYNIQIEDAPVRE